MPTYDYLCQSCGHRFEKFQSMTARVLRKCPECGQRSLERLIGPGAGFIFKGDGFYTTDYRSKSYQDGKKAAEGGDKKAGADTADKPDRPDKPDKPDKRAKPAKKAGTEPKTDSKS